MKHFYVAIIIFIFIISIGFYSNRYIDNSVVSITKEIKYSDNIQDINKAYELFESKKNILQVFVNKEHIDFIELNFILLDNRYQNKNYDEIKRISIEIINGLENIRNEITDFL